MFFILQQVYYSDQTFNNFEGYRNAPVGRRYLMAVPLMSMALTGLTYGWRWFEQYALLNNNNAYYKIAYLKENIKIHLGYVFVVWLSWILLVVCMHIDIISDYIRIYTIAIFFASWILIILSTKAFLKNIKEISYQNYVKSRKIIIFVTTIYTLFLFLRGFDMMIDYISQILYDDEDAILKDISVYSLITLYFLENIGLFVFILVLCLKVRSSNSILVLEDTNINSNTDDKEDSVYEKVPTFDSTDTYAKHNRNSYHQRDSVYTDDSLSDEEGFAQNSLPEPSKC